MAIGAEQAQVLEPVVEPVAVHVIELQREAKAPPVVESAACAAILE